MKYGRPLVFWIQLLLLFKSSFSQTFLSECQACCQQLFDELTGNSVNDLQLREGCEAGCARQLDGLQCGNRPEACQTGFDMRENGFADFNNLTAGEVVQVFCVEGSIEESAAPTASPTPPTNAPTTSPTRSPLISITTDTDSDSTLDSLPVIGGVAAGALLIGVIIIVLLIPKKKKPELADGLTDDYEESEAKPSKPSVLRENDDLAGLGGLSAVSPMFPNIHQAPSTLRQRQRLSLQQLRESQLLNPNAVKQTFQVTFDFEAEQDDELNATEGEILLGLYAVDADWWVVKREQTGEIGMVPLNFMQAINGQTPPVGPESLRLSNKEPSVPGEDDIF